jgi:L-aspartate oxidase
LVFGARAGEAAVADTEQRSITSRKSPVITKSEFSSGQAAIATAVRKRIKRVMWERVGIIRDRDSLMRALKEFEQMSAGKLGTSSRNFVSLAIMVATAALWREESRGGHFRSDFPDHHEEFRVHSIQKLGADISTSERMNFGVQATASENAGRE